ERYDGHGEEDMAEQHRVVYCGPDAFAFELCVETAHGDAVGNVADQEYYRQQEGPHHAPAVRVAVAGLDKDKSEREKHHRRSVQGGIDGGKVERHGKTFQISSQRSMTSVARMSGR